MAHCFSSNTMIAVGVAVTAGIGTGYLIASLTKKKKDEFFGNRKTMKSYECAHPLVKYTVEHSVRLLPIQERLRDVTLKHKLGFMMGAPEVTHLLQNLIRAINAKKVIEVGVFTGYTTLAMALAMPSDGKIVACDVNDEYMDIGRPFWKEAGVDGKITAKIQPAVYSLDELLAKGEAGTYDLAFIDADKVGYDIYYEKCLQLMRKGGVIALDNVLWSGSVLEDKPSNPGASHIKQLNDKLKIDTRVAVTMLILGDGLTLAVKL